MNDASSTSSLALWFAFILDGSSSLLQQQQLSNTHTHKQGTQVLPSGYPPWKVAALAQPFPSMGQ